MKLNILLYIFLINTCFSSYGEDYLPLADTDGGSAALVYNAVNVISGDYIETANDLTLLGPEPIIFQRLYSSSDYDAKSLYNNWRHNHDSFIQRPQKGPDAYFVTKIGSALPFKGHILGSHLSRLKFSKKDAKGYTNFGSSTIGGVAHAKNTRLIYDKKNKSAKVKDGNGIKSFFKSQKYAIKYELVDEKKPNGNKLHYIYNKEGKLSQIQASNSHGTMFSWLKLIWPSEKDVERDLHFEMHGSDGRRILYKLQRFRAPAITDTKFYRISEVISNDRPTIGYEYRAKSEKNTTDVHVSKKKNAKCQIPFYRLS